MKLILKRPAVDGETALGLHGAVVHATDAKTGDVVWF
jgi:hypothetical protein